MRDSALRYQPRLHHTANPKQALVAVLTSAACPELRPSGCPDDGLDLGAMPVPGYTGAPALSL